MTRKTEIHLRQRRRGIPVRLRALRRMVRLILEDLLREEGACLAVHLVGPRAMTRLNETFLGHEGPTDVITFDQSEGAPGTGLRGEIFVCLDVAQTQARAYGVPWQAELARYIVHGLLHLRGLDDTTPAARRTMKREEDRLVRRLTSRFPLSGLG